MEYTDIYQKYSKSHDYMQEHQLVRKTDRNWDFYIGNQWKGLNSNGEELPTANIIKQVVKYKISTIAQNNMTANYTDTEDTPEYVDVYKELNRRFARSWDKSKMDEILWSATKSAAIQGDTYVYFGSSDTNDIPQIISNTAILFGDENIQNIQEQPYIIIVERLPLARVKEIARENGISEDDIDTIYTDDDTDDVVYNKKEVSDKVTSYLYFEKDKDGIVQFARATKTCVYQELSPLIAEQGGKQVGSAKRYPIVPFIWEDKPNSARGVSEVEALIPNQIEINKTLARRAVAVRLAAFPRLAYDTTAIDDPSVLDKVGMAIGVNTGGAQSITQAISYLNATNISSDAQTLFNDLISQSKELSGASDTALGNININRTSGEAITAIRDQTQMPLDEQVNRKQKFVEDVALLWFDMWTTYDLGNFTMPITDSNGDQMSDEFGNKLTQNVTPDILEKIKPNVKIDVSEDNRWTKLSEQQALDNLLGQKLISLDEYAKLLPSNSVLPVSKLQKVLQERAALQAQQQAEQQQMLEQQQMQQQMPTDEQMQQEGMQ